MKSNLLQYLMEYGDRTFREVPFSEVDALVFAQLSYLKMKGIVPGFGISPGVSWKDMAQHPDAQQMFTDPLYGRQHRQVFRLAAAARRYRQVRVNYYKEWSDEERQGQFAAVTFLLGETSVFVAFRGTDETLVGWKEDFNMGYMKAVPSQRSALAYLKGAARYTKGRLILGGHSKGGNQALYAAAYAPEQVQQRIRRVYSFDGPGFQKRFYERRGYRMIEDRYCKIVPEQSLVGMLFADFKSYRVVKSYRAGVIQHDLMQWMIRDGKFVYLKELHGGSLRKSAVLNRWMDSLSRQQITVFVDTLYQVLSSAQVTSVYQMIRKPFRIIGILLGGFFRLDRMQRKTFRQIFGKLAAAVREDVRAEHRKGNAK